MDDNTFILVQSTRILNLGIGSFILLLGGILCILSCLLPLKQPTKFNIQLITTGLYAIMILYFFNAPRRSRWEVFDSDDEQGVSHDDDMDNTWLARIFVGAIISTGCAFGLFAVFRLDYCSMVVAKEVECDYGRERIHRPRKFLF